LPGCSVSRQDRLLPAEEELLSTGMLALASLTGNSHHFTEELMAPLSHARAHVYKYACALSPSHQRHHLYVTISFNKKWLQNTFEVDGRYLEHGNSYISGTCTEKI